MARQTRQSHRGSGAPAAVVLAGVAMVGWLLFAERHWPRRARTQPEPERTLRNATLGVMSLAVVALVQRPLAQPLARPRVVSRRERTILLDAGRAMLAGLGRGSAPKPGRQCATNTRSASNIRGIFPRRVTSNGWPPTSTQRNELQNRSRVRVDERDLHPK